MIPNPRLATIERYAEAVRYLGIALIIPGVATFFAEGVALYFGWSGVTDPSLPLVALGLLPAGVLFLIPGVFLFLARSSIVEVLRSTEHRRLRQGFVVAFVVLAFVPLAILSLPPPQRSLSFANSDFGPLLGPANNTTAQWRVSVPFALLQGETFTAYLFVTLHANVTGISPQTFGPLRPAVTLFQVSPTNGSLLVPGTAIGPGAFSVPQDGRYVLRVGSLYSGFDPGIDCISCTYAEYVPSVSGTLTVYEPYSYVPVEVAAAVAFVAMGFAAFYFGRPPWSRRNASDRLG